MQTFLVKTPDGRAFEVDGENENDAINYLQNALGGGTDSNAPIVPQRSSIDSTIDAYGQYLDRQGETSSEEAPQQDDTYLQDLLARAKRQRGFGDNFGPAFSRASTGVESTVTDLIPAAYYTFTGNEQAAKDQLAEAKAKQEEAARLNPPQFKGVEEVTASTALPFLGEKLGEALPATGATLGLAIAAPAAALALGASPALATAAGAATAYLGSFAMNAPNELQNLYDKTGNLELPAAAISGGLQSALDILPELRLAGKIAGPLKAAVTEKLLSKSGMNPSLIKSVAKETGIGFAGEGLTGGAQEAISIAAEKIVTENKDLWGSEEFSRVLNGAVNEAVGGLAFGPVAGAVDYGRQTNVIAERENAQRAEEEAAAKTQKDAEEAAELAGMAERYQAIDARLQETETNLAATPGSKQLQIQRDQVLAERKSLEARETLLKTPLEERAKIEAAKEKAPIAEGPKAARDYTVSDLLKELGVTEQEAAAAIKEYNNRPDKPAGEENFRVGFKDLARGDVANKFSTLLDILQPRHIADIKDDTDAQLEFGRRVDEVKATHPNLQSDQIEADKIAGIKPTQFGKEFKAITGDAKITAENAPQIYAALAARRDQVKPHNAPLADFFDAQIQKFNLLKEAQATALSGPVAAPAVAQRVVTPEVTPVEGPTAEEVESALQEEYDRQEAADQLAMDIADEQKQMAEKDFEVSKNKEQVEPDTGPIEYLQKNIDPRYGRIIESSEQFGALSKLGNDYTALNKMVGRQVALDHLVGNITLSKKFDKDSAEKRQEHLDYVDTDEFGKDPLDFSGTKEVDEAGNLSPYSALFQRSGGEYGKNFYNSLTWEEQQYVKNKVRELSDIELSVEQSRVDAEPETETEIDGETLEEAVSSVDVLPELYAKRDEIANQIAEITERGASESAIANVYKEYPTITREQAEEQAKNKELKALQKKADRIQGKISKVAELEEAPTLKELNDLSENMQELKNELAKDLENVVPLEIRQANIEGAPESYFRGRQKKLRAKLAEAKDRYDRGADVLEGAFNRLRNGVVRVGRALETAQKIKGEKETTLRSTLETQYDKLRKFVDLHPQFDYLVKEEELRKAFPTYRPPAVATTPEKAIDSLSRAMGRNVGNVVSVTATPEEAGLKNVPAGARAMVSPEGKAYLFTNMIPEGDELSVFLHEFGDHLGMRALVGNGNYNYLVNKVKEWASNPKGNSRENRLARQAIKRVPEKTNVDDEVLAYFIEEAVRDGIKPNDLQASVQPETLSESLKAFFNKVMGGVKNLLSKLRLNPENIKAQDIVDLAYGAAHLELDSQIPALSTKAPTIITAKRTKKPDRSAQIAKKFNEAKFSMAPKGEFISAPRVRKDTPARVIMREDPIGATETVSDVQTVADRVFGLMDSIVDAAPEWSQKTLKAVQNAIENPVAKDSRSLINNALSLRELAEETKTFNPEMSTAILDLHKAVSKRDYKATNYLQDMEKFYMKAKERLGKFDINAQKVFHNLVHQSTLKRIQFDKSQFKGHPLTKQFESMDADLQKLYFELRDQYAGILQKFLDQIETSEVLGPASKVLAKLMAKQITPYFPLFRRGDFWLRYVDPTTKEDWVLAFENNSDRRDAQNFLKSNGMVEIVPFRRPKEVTMDNLPPTRQFRDVIKLLEEKLPRDPNTKEMTDSAKDALNEVYGTWLTMFPTQSIMQNFRPRKGTLGFREDSLANFAEVGSRMAMNVAQFESIQSIDKAINAAKGARGKHPNAKDNAAWESIQYRVPFLKNPVQKDGFVGALAAKSGYLSYVYYLIGNPSTAIANYMQLPIIAVPVLGSRYGYTETTAAFSKATYMYFKGGYDDNTTMANPLTGKSMADRSIMGDKSKLSPEHRELFEAGLEQSAFTRTTAQELLEVRRKGLSDPTSMSLRVQTWLSRMFTNVERHNREVTLLAAYELARKGSSTRKKLEHAEAIEEAIKAVEEIHSSSKSELGPALAQTGFGKIALTFKRVIMSMLYLQYKLSKQMLAGATREEKYEALKALAGTNVMCWTFAGLKGVPVFGAVSLAASLTKSLIDKIDDDYDDEPLDPYKYVLTHWGRMAANGPLGVVTNIDWSSRTGLGADSLWKGDPQTLSESGPLIYMIEALGGPAYGIAKNMWEAIKIYNRGDTYRAIETAVPAVIKNPMKTWRYATDGVRNQKGYKIIDDPTFMELFTQLGGFTSDRLSETYERNNIASAEQRRGRELKSGLLARRNLAKYARDYEELREVEADIRQYNRSVWGRDDKIDNSTKEKSWNGWNQQMKDSVNGLSLDKKHRKHLIRSAGLEDIEED